MKEEIINLRTRAVTVIADVSTKQSLEKTRASYLGRKGSLTKVFQKIKDVEKVVEKKELGILINDTKKLILKEITLKLEKLEKDDKAKLDLTIPGTAPQTGHLHLITQAIDEITRIFERIGFTRSRYREIEWDWYAFEALGFDKDHPARDEWETFMINNPPHPLYGPMVLTPHTSSGQIREMERLGGPPIRMINIAKTYRRQSDVTHYPMFHQFEGMVVDKGISIAHLKGTIEYFAKAFYGDKREIRLRPYNFPFTEPSFEIDVSCGICDGKGCSFCKAGWHEIAGAGMIHPTVLENGKIDPKVYSGFAFGSGVERTMMMKPDLKIKDVRQLYSTDLRYLTQF